MGEPAGEPADREDAQQRSHRPADAAVAAAASECSAVGEHRSMSDEIEDEVVRLVGIGEVLTAVVDDVVSTERPHEVKLAGVVDAGHVRTESFGELDREGA
jgi:hypothetical protein